ncbi:MAG: hypothetical protein ACLFR1_01270 [Spirochaetia bacterium]
MDGIEILEVYASCEDAQKGKERKPISIIRFLVFFLVKIAAIFLIGIVIGSLF